MNSQVKPNKTALCCTMHTLNYGNRLQCYAIQTLLDSLSVDSSTLYVEPPVFGKKQKIKLSIHKITGYRFSHNPSFWKLGPLREKRFGEFNRKYIREKRVTNIRNIEEADYYFVGSDQVWNPRMLKHYPLRDELYFLTFADSVKKIAISASFGVDEISEDWVDYFRKWLNTFPSISVREEAGLEIVKKLTGKQAEVTIDPTLALNKEDWLKLAAKPDGVDCNKKYILTYFLGKGNEDRDNQIKQFASEIEIEEVYKMLDASQPELYVADPSEFLYLIQNASLVLTDSFHACVFSFLFGKPFLCYDRKNLDENGNVYNMNSRILTLVEKFNLERKYIGDGTDLDCITVDNLLECDYSKGYSLLESERTKLMNYLKKAMHID